jgi:flavin reductase (DIM6/NTAB) family NADH-FMN oxidoreductase RutF
MKKSLGAQTMPLPAPVWVVGTYDAEGRANMMTASWTGICCSRPPCVAVSLQKPRYSYGNLIARQAFTINVPSVQHARETDYWGIVSGKAGDKIGRTGLTVVAGERVDAPCIQEFPVVMECTLRQTIELGSHTQFIGEVVDVKVEEALLDASGALDPEKLKVFVFIGGGYRALGEFLGPAFSIGRAVGEPAAE